MAVSFCNEVIELVELNCFAFTEQSIKTPYEEFFLVIEKCDVCLLVLLRYLLHLIDIETIREAKEALKMLKVIERNDLKRQQWVKSLDLGIEPPLLYPTVSKMFNIHLRM